uniref:Uncharacterized protein n=1 Tax=Kalanchoe fedtschenkoi TaxID=63787 RepID=A0A7N0RF66_KALFE
MANITHSITSAAAAASAAKIQVEGIQSVIPLRPTDPRHTRKVTLKHPQTTDIFQRCHHVILYYKKASEDDSGWVVGGRLKESVGRALLEYPMIAGRLRWADDRPKDSNGGQRELELVSNDSGIRLVEAKLPMSLAEFFEMKEREDVEGELVFWEPLNEEDPQFCPLAYVQVTNFECGGYSIGFSLNVVLGDPLELTGFLKHSAKLHKEMFQENKAPVFYLPKLKTNYNFPPEPSGVTNPKQAGRTLLYALNADNSGKEDFGSPRRLALSCIHDAERRLSVDTDYDFALFIKDHKTGDLTVEAGSRRGLSSGSTPTSAGPELKCTEWGDAHFDEMMFWGSHKPARVAHWIGLRANEGLVMVSSPRVEGDSGAVDVMVTIPYQK